MQFQLQPIHRTPFCGTVTEEDLQVGRFALVIRVNILLDSICPAVARPSVSTLHFFFRLLHKNNTASDLRSDDPLHDWESKQTRRLPRTTSHPFTFSVGTNTSVARLRLIQHTDHRFGVAFYRPIPTNLPLKKGNSSPLSPTRRQL